MTIRNQRVAPRRTAAIALVLALALLVAAGCNAKFTDLRPNKGTSDIQTSDDTTTPDVVSDATADTAPSDASSEDSEPGDDTTEADSESDTQTIDQSGGSEKVIAEGDIVGTMYPAIKGFAQLVKRADGKIVLRIKNLVMVDVPGPSIVLTSRTSPIGALDEANGDILVAPLSKPFQSDYEWVLPNGDGGRRNVVAHCTPFGIDMGNGVLTDVP